MHTFSFTAFLERGFTIARPQSLTWGLNSSSSKILAAFKLLWDIGGTNDECMYLRGKKRKAPFFLY